MQVYVPLNTPVTYEETKPFAHALARLLENEHRDLVVSDMKKAVRTNKVFVDWSQNDEHKTTISVYSLRARERPTVSTPVTWEEVEQLWKKKDANMLVFEAPQLLERVEKVGDLFEPVLSMKQKLPNVGTLAEGPPVPGVVDLAAQAEEEVEQPEKGRDARKVAVKANQAGATRKKSTAAKKTPVKTGPTKKTVVKKRAAGRGRALQAGKSRRKV